jgi:hypothetical protein
MEKLLRDWSLSNGAEYFLVGLGLQVGIRIFMSAISALAETHRSQRRVSAPRFLIYFSRCFWGWHPKDKEGHKSDYCLPFVLGLLELYSYPVLMATGAWTVIGAWIGLKSVAQWSRWSTDRITFDRYLIGNALVVLLSLLVMVPYVKVAVTH